jgi:DNA-binding transcriptional regulator YiaG
MCGIHDESRTDEGEQHADRQTDTAPTDTSSWATIRKNSGISATQFAAAVGISVPTMYSWENGSHNPTGPNREAYAKALRQLQQQAVPDA